MPEERVTVVYRGTSRLDAQASVVREGRVVGLVEKVVNDTETQHVLIRIKNAGELRKNDRYLPRRDANGRVGFHVISGGGEPLFSGAIVEAGFSSPKSPNLSVIVPPAPEDPHYKPEGSGELPGSKAQTSDWYRGSAQEDLAAFRLEDASEFQSVPPALRNDVLSLPVRARQLQPAEAVLFLKGESRQIDAQFENELAGAYEKNDRQAIRQLRAMRARTEPLLRKLKNQASRAATGAARP